VWNWRLIRDGAVSEHGSQEGYIPNKGGRKQQGLAAVAILDVSGMNDGDGAANHSVILPERDASCPMIFLPAIR